MEGSWHPVWDIFLPGSLHPAHPRFFVSGRLPGGWFGCLAPPSEVGVSAWRLVCVYTASAEACCLTQGCLKQPGSMCLSPLKRLQPSSNVLLLQGMLAPPFMGRTCCVGTQVGCQGLGLAGFSAAQLPASPMTFLGANRFETWARKRCPMGSPSAETFAASGQRIDSLGPRGVDSSVSFASQITQKMSENSVLFSSPRSASKTYDFQCFVTQPAAFQKTRIESLLVFHLRVPVASGSRLCQFRLETIALQGR